MNRRDTLVALAALGTFPATAGGETRAMDPTATNKVVVRDMIDKVWRQGRLDQLPAFWTSDCVNHADPAPKK